MERVKKGEKYWHIVCDCDGLDAEEAGQMVRKLRAVLKGADVIEMPSEAEIFLKIENSRIVKGVYGWGAAHIGRSLAIDMVKWLKSKCIR